MLTAAPPDAGAAGRAAAGEALHCQQPLNLAKTLLGQHSDGTSDGAGGCASGRSDGSQHTTVAGLPASPAAATADTRAADDSPRPSPAAGGSSSQQAPTAASPAPAPAAAAVPARPPPSPQPPPDPSEGPEIAAEYETYLQRWAAGVTLAQRWHRLAESGKLADVQADWEEWQQDMLLEELRRQHKPASGRATRARRREPEELGEADELGPRRVRSRRAPGYLAQDYHVEHAPLAGSPEPQDGDAAAPAGRHSGSQHASEEDDGDDGDSTSQQQQQPRQRQPATRGRAAQQQQPAQPPRRVVTRVARSPQQQQQPQSAGAAHLNRLVYRGAHAQQFAQLQALQLAQHAAQHAAAVDPVAGMAVTPELVQQLYQLGAQLGAAMSAGAGAHGGGGNPGLAAFAELMRGQGLAQNPAAVVQLQQLVMALMQQQQAQQQQQ